MSAMHFVASSLMGNTHTLSGLPLLMGRAWDDDTPDRERLLLEQGARVIEHLLARLAIVTEREEARRAVR